MTMPSTRIEVESLVRQFDHTFEATEAEFGSNQWHSISENLSSVRPEEWDLQVPGGVRTIRELVTHIGGCYSMYENHGFGDRTMRWEDDDAINGHLPEESPEQMIAWLQAAHGRFRASLARLTDDQLDEPAFGHWGGRIETRRLVELMLQHGIYHAGEIGYLRALPQGNDDWNHQDMGRDEET